MIESPLALSALIAAAAALGFWLEHRYLWSQKIGASLLVIVFGALLSNFGLVPVGSPVYDAIFGPVTSLAIVWLLLAVDLRDLRAAGPRMLAGFAVAVVATVAAALVAALLFSDVLGDRAWKLAGVMTGTYSGGSLNFVSVGRALELPQSLFTAAAAADNVMTAVWMGATLMLPVWLRRWYPPPTGASAPLHDAPDAPAKDTGSSTSEQSGPHPSPLAPAPLRVTDLAILLAIGLVLQVVAERAADVLPGVSVIWLTTLALVVGQLPPVRRLRGSMHLGTLALNLFFVVIGIGSRVAEILAVGLEIFYFTATVVLLHGLITYGVGRLVRLDLDTLSVASQAAVGGPSTAMALAVGRNRPQLALPGIMVGLLGYAVGTYAGLAVASLLASLLG